MILSNGKNSRAIKIIGLIIAVISWGMLPYSQKILLQKLTPIDLTIVRFICVGFLFLPWIVIKKRKRLARLLKNDSKKMIIISLVGPATAMLLYNIALKSSSVSLVAVIVALEPIFTLIFAIIFKQESWRKNRFIAIMISLIGLYSITSIDGFWAKGVESFLILVLIPIIWACNTVLSKPLISSYGPALIMGSSFIMSALLYSFWLNTKVLFVITDLTLIEYSMLGFSVLFATFLGFFFWYSALDIMPASQLASWTYLIPVISALSGVILLGETISYNFILGAVIILYGTYLGERPLKSMQGAPQS